MKPTNSNKTGQSTIQDVVMTPYHTAKWIVEHFEPQGKMLEPCRGEGAFYTAMQEYKSSRLCKSIRVSEERQSTNDDVDWCEISEGKDFFDYNGKVDWIITNPPYSIFDDFLDKAFEVADNVVFFVPFSKLFKSKSNDQAVMKYGDVKEIVNLGTGNAHGFPVGFMVGAIHYQRNYKGDIKFSRNYF